MAFRFVILLLACSGVIFLLKREVGRGSFLDVSNRVYLDFLIGNSKDKIGDPAVILVSINDEQSTRPDPWYCAVLLSKLLPYKPKVTVMTEVLDWEPDESQPHFSTSVASVADIAEKVPSLVLSAVVMEDPASSGSEGEDEKGRAARFDLFPNLENIEGDVEQLPRCNLVSQMPDHLLSQGTLKQAARTSKRTGFYLGLGFSHIDLGEALDQEEEALLMPLLARTDSGQVIPSLVLQAVLFERKRTVKDIEVRLGKEIQVDEELSIPIDRQGRLRIFLGFRDRIPRVDAGSMLVDGIEDSPEAENAGGEDGKPASAKEEEAAGDLLGSNVGLLKEARNNIVVLGSDSELARVVELPGGTLLSRAEITALALATIQGNQYFKRFDELWTYAVWAGIILIGMWEVGMPRRKVPLVSFVLLVLYASASIFTFQATQRWTGAIIPLALMLTCTLVAILLPQIERVSAPVSSGRKPGETPE